MKNLKSLVWAFALVFALGTTVTSCRETKNDIEVESDDLDDAIDDAGDAIEDAADDAGDAINEGVDEVKENTGTGGTDDN